MIYSHGLGRRERQWTKSQGRRWCSRSPEPFQMRAPKATPTTPLTMRFDLIALVLLAVGLLLAACVLSHNPTQVPDATFPPEFSSANLLGAPGAMLAENLFDALGIAIYVLLAGWFILTVTLYFQRDLVRW